MKLNLPPRIKVLEALGSIADGRVRVVSEEFAEVVSSTGDRKYEVLVNLNKGVAYSNDNGTVFRNYVGYPIIAFLMVKGILPYDSKLANALRGINWRKLNEAYKNYYAVERYVKSLLKRRGFNEDYIDNFIEQVLKKLKEISLSKSEEVAK